MNYTFSIKSLVKLEQCHDDIKNVMLKAITNSPYYFGITCGYRHPMEQIELYKKGRIYPGDIVTYKDGVTNKSKHNFHPSKAIDIVIFVNKKVTWDEKYYKEVAEHIIDISDSMFLSGEIKKQIKWGGNFKNFADLPHFEI